MDRGRVINNLQYTNDVVLIATSAQEQQELPEQVKKRLTIAVIQHIQN